MKRVLQMGVLTVFVAPYCMAYDSSCEDLVKQERWQEAYAVYEETAASGNLEAQLSLGDMYIEGRISPPDVVAAIHWYERAAKQKSVEAHAKLAQIYGEGQGVEKDAEAALAWSISAAELGSPPAQLNLGLIYERGIFTPQDYVKAHMWLNLAGAQGNEYARTKREEVEGKMTLQSIEKAQRLARECMKKNYQDCG